MLRKRSNIHEDDSDENSGSESCSSIEDEIVCDSSIFVKVEPDEDNDFEEEYDPLGSYFPVKHEIEEEPSSPEAAPKKKSPRGRKGKKELEKSKGTTRAEKNRKQASSKKKSPRGRSEVTKAPIKETGRRKKASEMTEIERERAQAKWREEARNRRAAKRAAASSAKGEDEVNHKNGGSEEKEEEDDSGGNNKSRAKRKSSGGKRKKVSEMSEKEREEAKLKWKEEARKRRAAKKVVAELELISDVGKSKDEDKPVSKKRRGTPRKKVSEMTEEEQEAARAKWRLETRMRRANKRDSASAGAEENKKSSRTTKDDSITKEITRFKAKEMGRRKKVSEMSEEEREIWKVKWREEARLRRQRQRESMTEEERRERLARENERKRQLRQAAVLLTLQDESFALRMQERRLEENQKKRLRNLEKSTMMTEQEKTELKQKHALRRLEKLAQMTPEELMAMRERQRSKRRGELTHEQRELRRQKVREWRANWTPEQRLRYNQQMNVYYYRRRAQFRENPEKHAEYLQRVREKKKLSNQKFGRRRIVCPLARQRFYAVASLKARIKRQQLETAEAREQRLMKQSMGAAKMKVRKQLMAMGAPPEQIEEEVNVVERTFEYTRKEFKPFKVRKPVQKEELEWLESQRQKRSSSVTGTGSTSASMEMEIEVSPEIKEQARPTRGRKKIATVSSHSIAAPVTRNTRKSLSCHMDLNFTPNQALNLTSTSAQAYNHHYNSSSLSSQEVSYPQERLPYQQPFSSYPTAGSSYATIENENVTFEHSQENNSSTASYHDVAEDSPGGYSPPASPPAYDDPNDIDEDDEDQSIQAEPDRTEIKENFASGNEKLPTIVDKKNLETKVAATFNEGKPLHVPKLRTKGLRINKRGGGFRGPKPKGPDVVTCEICGRPLSKGHLPKHMETVHNPNYNFEEGTCRICGGVYSQAQYWYEHYRYEHLKLDKKPGIPQTPRAPRLAQTSKSKGRLQTAIDPAKCSFLCTTCGAAYPTQRLLEKHEYSWHGEGAKPENYLSCHICGNRLKTKQSLSLHIRRVHDNKKRVAPDRKCEKCDLEINVLPKLSDHVKETHPGFHFPCEYCNSFAYSRITYMFHLSKCEKISGADRPNILQALVDTGDVEFWKETVPCEFCPKSVKIVSLDGHYKKMHRLKYEQLYQCPKCPVQFKYRQSFICHLDVRHGLPLKECLEIGSKFGFSGDRETLEVHNREGKFIMPDGWRESQKEMWKRKREQAIAEGRVSKRKPAAGRRRAKPKKNDSENEASEEEENHSETSEEEEDCPTEDESESEEEEEEVDSLPKTKAKATTTKGKVEVKGSKRPRSVKSKKSAAKNSKAKSKKSDEDCPVKIKEEPVSEDEEEEYSRPTRASARIARNKVQQCQRRKESESESDSSSSTSSEESDSD